MTAKILDFEEFKNRRDKKKADEENARIYKSVEKLIAHLIPKPENDLPAK